MSRQSRKTVTPFQSVVAGVAAGGVESLVTYPTEYVKTRKQLLRSPESPLRILISTVRTSGLSGLYAGAGAFVASNASKSGVRFFTFDLVRRWLPKDGETGRPSKTATMVAGVAAGTAESVTVVTPGENIKTRIIQDRGAAERRFKSTTQLVRNIMATEGPRGFFRGLVPVTMKQSSNALVRFTSYAALLGAIEPILGGLGSGAVAPAVAGGLAGVVTVYTTMPFDVVKTKMQVASKLGTWGVFSRIVREEGVRGLWRGTTPRLARLSVSGAVSFTIYEKVTELLQREPNGMLDRVEEITQ